ncbi:Microtubule associated protein (MAP65/ASE1 family) [Musa troglodytarum]|uniref:Microtubule associated protein (MAP65/ASE1 family) n=1 Tax=Musa troglodytarum TaxID=320322 RepID=A0A9E7HNV5_9LILI|nr:Microtubule associated protein (MAP65/ASE1 family) [Musa troglodytarum]
MYRRKVDSANILRVCLHQALADSEAEFTNLLLSLGERSFPGQPEKLTGTLKQQLDAITPALHEMQLRRMNQFGRSRHKSKELLLK